MLTEKQLQEIRDLLNKAENPLFYFNEDPDGLCAYLLLSKYINKGKYVSVKSANLSAEQVFVRKLEELNPDLVIILDEAKVEEEFLSQARCPVLWIDHHPVQTTTVHYYNPRSKNKEDNRSTTFWAYQVTKQNLWIAAVGSLSDWELTEITDEFSKEFPDLFQKGIKTPEQGLYETKLGELVKIFCLLLKGTTTDIRKSVTVLSKIKSPEEILDQLTPKGKFIYKRVENIKKEYNQVLEKALKVTPKDNVFSFLYRPKKNSFNAMLANELIYFKPGQVVIVGREKEEAVTFSIRSPNSSPIILPPILEEITKDLEKATCGGHDHSCGAVIKREDAQTFLTRFKEAIERNIKTKIN